MVRQAAIVAKADRYGFVAAIHRNEIDVDIDDEIALDRAPVDAHLLAAVGLSEIDDTARLFCVVTVVAVRIKRVVDLGPHHAAHLRLRHLPVERVRDYDVDVVDAVILEQLENDFERRLPRVRCDHRG